MSAGSKTLGLVMAGDIEHRKDYRTFLRSISQVFTINSRSNNQQEQQQYSANKYKSSSNISSHSQSNNNNNNNTFTILPIVRIVTTPDIFSDCQNIDKPIDYKLRLSSMYEISQDNAISRRNSTAPSGPKLALAPAPGTTTATVTMPATVSVEAPPAEPIYGTVIPNRIFVGGISRDTTESDLMIAFSAYGSVRSTKIIIDQDGFNKGYGFVTFETEEEAQRLQTVGKCVVLRNRRLNIAPAFKKQQLRPKLQPIIEANGTVYFTTQPSVGTIPIEQYAYRPAGSVAEYAAAAMPTLYQQAPAGVQYQPVYQYYSVPVNVPAVWPSNYFQEPQASNSQTSIQHHSSWEFDGANNTSWRST